MDNKNRMKYIIEKKSPKSYWPNLLSTTHDFNQVGQRLDGKKHRLCRAMLYDGTLRILIGSRVATRDQVAIIDGADAEMIAAIEWKIVELRQQKSDLIKTAKKRPINDEEVKELQEART